MTDKLILARQLRANHIFAVSETDSIANIRALTKGGAKYAFDRAGSAKATEAAYAVTRRGGSTISAGLAPPHAPPFRAHHAVGRQRRLGSIGGGRRAAAGHHF